MRWLSLLVVAILGALSTRAAAASYDELTRAAASYAGTGKSDRAAELAGQAAALSPERPEAYLIWGRALAQSNKLKESAEKYELARQHGSRDRALYLELASVYDVSQKYEEAMAVYRDFLGREPDDAEMQQELGLTLLLLARAGEAVTALEHAAKLSPDDEQLQQDLGYALLKAGRGKDAIAHLEPLARDSERPDAVLFLAQAYAAANRNKDAALTLDKILAARPDHSAALRLRGHLRSRNGDAEGALADFNRLLAGGSADAELLLGAAGALIVLNRIDEAAHLLDQARPLNANDQLLAFRDLQIAWRRNDKSALDKLATLARKSQSAGAWQEVAAAAAKFGNAKLEKEARAAAKRLSETPPPTSR